MFWCILAPEDRGGKLQVFVRRGSLHVVFSPLPGPLLGEGEDILCLTRQTTPAEIVRSPAGEFWVWEGVSEAAGISNRAQLNTLSGELRSVEGGR